MSDLAVGVLALQGDALPHVAALRAAGAAPREVRAPADLDGLTHLVLPGGESTTLAHLLDLFELREPLVERFRAGRLALFGTCAGAILLGRDEEDGPPRRLGLLDASVRRNAYGRQADSFAAALPVAALGSPPVEAVFIRAPRIVACGPAVEVLARCGDDPVLVRAPGLLAATFHPELTDDPRVHRMFLGLRPVRGEAAAAR